MMSNFGGFMKKSILLFIILLVSTIAYSQEAFTKPKNSVNIIVNDILKLDVSSFSGDISYSRIITDSIKTTVGISSDYNCEMSETYSADTEEKTWGVGLSASVLYAFGQSNIKPYVGVGISGSFRKETKEETTVAGEQVNNANIYSIAGLVPLGIEYNLAKRVIIGLGNNLRIQYYCTEAKTKIEDGSSVKSNNYGYSFSIDKPQVMMSILF